MAPKRITHQSLLTALLIGCISCMNQTLHSLQQEVPDISTNAGKDEFIQALEQGDVAYIGQLIAARKVSKQDINTPIPLLAAPLPAA
ncbi:MAG: hypothetical protein AAF392_02960 [Bacteroidota bacterium]